LRDEWKDIETGVPLRVVHDDHHHRKIHDRMPALLTPYQFDSWLSGGAGPELLRPWDQRSLQMYPVSRRVSSSKAAGDDTTLIERIEV
jgi:putative SOS response-associated peptidase YedK